MDPSRTPTASTSATRLKTLLLGIALANTLASAEAATPQKYTIKTVDVPFAAARDTQPHGLNHAGWIVGTYNDDWMSAQPLGFRMKNGVTSMLPMISPQAINKDGLMTGWYLSYDGVTRGFLHTGQQFLPLYVPDSSESQGRGINSVADVVGTYRSDTDGGNWHAFLYHPNTGEYANYDPPYEGASHTGLTGINNIGVMVGWYNARGYAVDTTSGTFYQLDVPGAIWTAPQGINDANTVVGLYALEDELVKGFVYKQGVYTPFLVPGAKETYLQRINDKGVITGYYFTEDTAVYHGFTATPRK